MGIAKVDNSFIEDLRKGFERDLGCDVLIHYDPMVMMYNIILIDRITRKSKCIKTDVYHMLDSLSLRALKNQVTVAYTDLIEETRIKTITLTIEDYEKLQDTIETQQSLIETLKRIIERSDYHYGR